MTALEDYVKNTSRFVQRFVLVVVAGSLMVVLAACNVSSARRTASNLAGDTAAVGVDVAQPEARDELLAALAPAKGLRVVEIKTDRRRATDLHQRLAEAVRSSRGT